MKLKKHRNCENSLLRRKNFDDLLSKRLKDKNFKKEFEVAKEIILLRQRAGMTQKELASRAKNSQAAISRLESGTYRNVSLSFLRRVGAPLGVKPHVNFIHYTPNKAFKPNVNWRRLGFMAV